jgi:hypothetical protein
VLAHSNGGLGGGRGGGLCGFGCGGLGLGKVYMLVVLFNIMGLVSLEARVYNIIFYIHIF